jgi:hypothetical protein
MGSKVGMDWEGGNIALQRAHLKIELKRMASSASSQSPM